MASTSHTPAMRFPRSDHAASTSQGSKTAPLVLSDSEDTTSDLSDYDSHSDASYRDTSKATSTTTKKKRRSRTSLTSSHNKKRWTHAEDKLLIKAVDQYGNDWVEVEKSLERSGVEAVRGRALRKRYKFIEEAAMRQVEIARHNTNAGALTSTSTSSSSTKELSATTLIAASAALHSRSGTQIFQAWTQQELEKLKEIGRQASSLQDVFPAFVRAFPTTTRSKHSVNIKWQRMRFGSSYGKDKGRKRRRRAVEESDEEEEEEEEDNGDESEEEDEEQRQQQPQVQHHTGSKRRRYDPRAEPSQTTSAVFAPTFRAAAYQSLSTATHPLNTLITRTANGFLIQSCPPGHGVLVSSPTSIQLVNPGWRSSHEHQEEVAASLLAVKRLTDGSFQALKLPMGCETSMAVVRGGHGGGEVWI